MAAGASSENHTDCPSPKSVHSREAVHALFFKWVGTANANGWHVPFTCQLERRSVCLTPSRAVTPSHAGHC